MAILDYILDGLEAALELERELGVRSVELDRSLLVTAVSPLSNVSRLASSPVEDARRKTLDARRETPHPIAQSPNRPITQSPNHPITQSPNHPITQSPNHPIAQSPNHPISSLVFLHDRPLSSGGVEMMAKIITALGLTAETAPIVVAPPLPQAKIAVVLGGRALKRYFPDVKGEPGMWIKRPEGQEVLITYSPEYILRFATVTPAVEKIKKDMWRSLKAVKQRISA